MAFLINIFINSIPSVSHTHEVTDDRSLYVICAVLLNNSLNESLSLSLFDVIAHRSNQYSIQPQYSKADFTLSVHFTVHMNPDFRYFPLSFDFLHSTHIIEMRCMKDRSCTDFPINNSTSRSHSSNELFTFAWSSYFHSIQCNLKMLSMNMKIHKKWNE